MKSLGAKQRVGFVSGGAVCPFASLINGLMFA
jgi:hypothetical protein